MAVIGALGRALDAIRRNPVMFAVSGLIGLLQIPQLAAQAAGPPVATLVSTVFSLGFVVVLPFLMGGAIAMAAEALDGQTSLGTFIEGGRANYVQLLIGYAVLLGVNMAIIVGGLVLLVAGGAVVLVLLPDPTNAVLPLALLALLGLSVLAAYLLVAFFVQFYGQAIVVDERPAMDGLRRSVRLVRANLLAVVGYSLVVGIAAGVFGLAVGGLSILLTPSPPGAPDLPTLDPVGLVAALVVVVVTALLGAVFLTYSVAFYCAVRDRTALAG